MSLSMAAGQLGFGAGGAIAGPAYSMYGYVSNTLIGALSVVLTALLVWRLLPERQLKTA
jgi:predicted MFS family arabinose efflux permease